MLPNLFSARALLNLCHFLLKSSRHPKKPPPPIIILPPHYPPLLPAILIPRFNLSLHYLPQVCHEGLPNTGIPYIFLKSSPPLFTSSVTPVFTGAVTNPLSVTLPKLTASISKPPISVRVGTRDIIVNEFATDHLGYHECPTTMPVENCGDGCFTFKLDNKQ